MYKKFVLLNSTQSPSRNPYEVRTFMGEQKKSTMPEWHVESCSYERDCEKPPNSTLAQVLTLEDEIKRIHRKTKENRFQKPFKQICAYGDEYTCCVVPQRTPQELKQHVIGREGFLKMKRQMSEYAHDMNDLYSNHPSLVKLDSPLQSEEEEEEDDMEIEEEDGFVKVELASPECSVDQFYLPTQRLLKLKRPKSGLFINETLPPTFSPDDNVPYSTYNPRLMQEEFDAQNLQRIDVIPGPRNDLWTWNVGVQQKEEQLDQAFIDSAVPRFDCDNMDLVVFKVPTDLDKTFTAGIVFGNLAVIPSETKGKPEFFFRPVEMACLYVAFVEGFRLNADFWTASTMDNIIDMGQKLVEKSDKMNYKSDHNDYDIIPEIVERQAVINIKVHFTGPLKSQPNIYKALTLYFSKYNAGVLCSKNLYLLIWKRCKNFFYIYDPNGRTENCERDFENGKCALMSTHFVEHLVHLIVNIGETNLEDEFNLYEMILINYGKIADPMQSLPFPKRVRRQWAVINHAYALIPSCNYGLQQPNSTIEQNPSLLIGVMALLYPYIQRPSTWDTNTVDQLIRIGTAYYKSLRRKMKIKNNIHVNIIDIPDKYVLGYYKASIKKQPFFYTGTVTDYCKKYIDSLLASGLKELFFSKWEACLLQIDNSVVAIWRDKELFYLFDPFRRGKSGQVLDVEDYKIQGNGVVQLHASFESLLRMVYQNALKMRRGGKFFIHAINVGCIKPIMDGKKRKLRYTGLKLLPDHLETEEFLSKEAGDEKDKKDKKDKKTKKEKKGKKSKKPHKICLIEAVKEEDRLAAFDDADVVDSLLDEIICEVLQDLPESIVDRERLYKCAEKVLLRSDKDYLESLKYMVKHHTDYDNYNATFQTQQEQETTIPTLETELALASNYQNLPDGSWVIFGNEILPRLDEEQFKLQGLLSALVTAAMVSRYKISTWNNNLIDYALRAVDTFSEEFQVYQYALGALFTKKLPRISIGRNTFQISIQKIIKSDLRKSLREVLLDSLISNNRILVICQRFSCLIVKRYNFLYMFIGFPVNPVGYRKLNNGPACMVRFIELDSLIRRIEYGCNPEGCDITKYVVVTLKVADVSSYPMDRYKPYPPSMDERIYREESDMYKKAEANRLAKMRFLEDELAKEDARIKKFMEEKAARIKSRQERKDRYKAKSRKIRIIKQDTDKTDEDEDFIYEDVEEEMGEEEDECDIEPKHKSGRKLAKTYEDNFRPRPVLYGYRLREKDFLHKIQGSKALQGRGEILLDQIKPCFFASTLAILYAILRPLNQWTTQRIDQLIDSAILLFEKLDDVDTSHERTLSHVNVDEYTFDILVRIYQPIGDGLTLEKQLKQGTSVRKYLVFHTGNCTYAIYKDQYYHLFDPYPSMELTNIEEYEEEEDEFEKNRKIYKGIRKYGERNTASWILFADIKSMVQYINQRSGNPSWIEDREYTFHVVDVLSYKKSQKNAHVLQLLTDMAPCDTDDVNEMASCAHNESIAWLEHCLPVWSRLNRRNAAGRYRNMGVSKAKKYDIEIEDRLWSLWGSIHPSAPVFDEISRGKQFLACSVVSLCAANLYRIIDWSSQLLDSIVINGDRYHQQSLNNIKCVDYEFSTEDLNLECWLDNVRFEVHMEHVVYGKLYCRPTYSRLNLAHALMYFFTYFRFGILQCFHKCLAIGHIPGNNGGYFMYDCQSRDHPLFPTGQGASYVLRTKHLQVLLYSIVVTLNVPYYNILFTIHKVEMLPDGVTMDDDGQANNQDDNAYEE